MPDSQLCDGNWGDFVESIFAYDRFEAFQGFFLFNEQAHAETEHERENDHNGQVCQFFGAFQLGLVEVKAGRLKVLE